MLRDIVINQPAQEPTAPALFLSFDEDMVERRHNRENWRTDFTVKDERVIVTMYHTRPVSGRKRSAIELARENRIPLGQLLFFVRKHSDIQ